MNIPAYLNNCILKKSGIKYFIFLVCEEQELDFCNISNIETLASSGKIRLVDSISAAKGLADVSTKTLNNCGIDRLITGKKYEIKFRDFTDTLSNQKKCFYKKLEKQNIYYRFAFIDCNDDLYLNSQGMPFEYYMQIDLDNSTFNSIQFLEGVIVLKDINMPLKSPYHVDLIKTLRDYQNYLNDELITDNPDICV